MSIERKAVIHSLVHTDDIYRTVSIKKYDDLNNILVEYNGLLCTAVDNPFTGYLYVDDVYGVVGKAV